MTTTTLAPPTEIIRLSGISWQTYETLHAELSINRRFRLTYNRGNLEIMAPSPEHELCKKVIGRFVETLAEELKVKIYPLGSTTFKHPQLSGAEPDECFYIHNRVIFLHSSLFNAQSPDDAISAQACATSIIIFNLGLACQHYGTRYQDMAKLRNACELYELAATWAVGGEEIGQLKQISAALTWAALNNQGQILYRLLGEHDIAVALLSPQLGLRPEGVEFSPCQLLEQEHFDEILFNILTVTSGIATVASPAA